MSYFKVAGHLFCVDSLIKIPSYWKSFLVGECRPEFCVCIVNTVPLNKHIQFANIQSGNKIMVSGQSVMITDEMYQYAYIYPFEQSAFDIFSMLLFSSCVYRNEMLQFHCSVIEDEGRGVLFLGPSGIGKTTQAERWAEYRGSTIVNGDVGFVERTTNGYVAWGTPWHGSSSYCLNTSVPIKALVVLKQASKNELRELTGFEKVCEVSSHIFYPTWLENGMELCTKTLNHLLNDLPVYRLDNRADEEAVKLLADEIDKLK